VRGRGLAGAGGRGEAGGGGGGRGGRGRGLGGGVDDGRDGGRVVLDGKGRKLVFFLGGRCCFGEACVGGGLSGWWTKGCAQGERERTAKGRRDRKRRKRRSRRRERRRRAARSSRLPICRCGARARPRDPAPARRIPLLRALAPRHSCRPARATDLLLHCGWLLADVQERLVARCSLLVALLFFRVFGCCLWSSTPARWRSRWRGVCVGSVTGNVLRVVGGARSNN